MNSLLFAALVSFLFSLVPPPRPQSLPPLGHRGRSGDPSRARRQPISPAGCIALALGLP
jgi:hypothetical protein